MKRIHFEKIDSTHLYAKRHMEEFDDITIITASFQENGIGRKKDPWITPKDSSLLLSIVYDTPPKEVIPYLSQIGAIALKNTLSSLDLSTSFKFPNDLMVHGRKLAGIMSEVHGKKALTSAGLNIFQTEKELKDINQPATSLLIETGKKFSRDKILQTFLSQFFTSLSSPSF